MAPPAVLLGKHLLLTSPQSLIFTLLSNGPTSDRCRLPRPHQYRAPLLHIFFLFRLWLLEWPAGGAGENMMAADPKQKSDNREENVPATETAKAKVRT